MSNFEMQKKINEFSKTIYLIKLTYKERESQKNPMTLDKFLKLV